MASFNDFESNEVSITYNGGRLVVKNKKTGESRYARSFFSPSTGYCEAWKVFSRELQEVSDSDISMQISLNEEEPGHYFKFALWGVPTEELYAELEARENDPPVPVVNNRSSAIKIMLKELGLPTYETLKRHKKKSAASA